MKEFKRKYPLLGGNKSDIEVKDIDGVQAVVEKRLIQVEETDLILLPPREEKPELYPLRGILNTRKREYEEIRRDELERDLALQTEMLDELAAEKTIRTKEYLQKQNAMATYVEYCDNIASYEKSIEEVKKSSISDADKQKVIEKYTEMINKCRALQDEVLSKIDDTLAIASIIQKIEDQKNKAGQNSEREEAENWFRDVDPYMAEDMQDALASMHESEFEIGESETVDETDMTPPRDEQESTTNETMSFSSEAPDETQMQDGYNSGFDEGDQNRADEPTQNLQENTKENVVETAPQEPQDLDYSFLDNITAQNIPDEVEPYSDGGISEKLDSILKSAENNIVTDNESEIEKEQSKFMEAIEHDTVISSAHIPKLDEAKETQSSQAESVTVSSQEKSQSNDIKQKIAAATKRNTKTNEKRAKKTKQYIQKDIDNVSADIAEASTENPDAKEDYVQIIEDIKTKTREKKEELNKLMKNKGRKSTDDEQENKEDNSNSNPSKDATKNTEENNSSSSTSAIMAMMADDDD